uniref:Uncharacterized protein n=1 Tax=Arundo donax TaxID=35708 RepID=A0A0A9G897_ARUDO
MAAGSGSIGWQLRVRGGAGVAGQGARRVTLDAGRCSVGRRDSRSSSSSPYTASGRVVLAIGFVSVESKYQIQIFLRLRPVCC